MRERDRWAASADAWDRWADPMADLADKLNHPLLDAAGLTPALMSAARRAGLDGLVVDGIVPAVTCADRRGMVS